MNSKSAFHKLSLLLLGFGVLPAFAVSEKGDLPNFYKVDDHVYRGAQPSASGFHNLAQMGVKTIIDLRGSEHDLDAEKRIVEANGMRYISIPMLGMHKPTDQPISTARSLMNDPAAGPVFIHCQRGADRTGAVVACYRIGHDHWMQAKALHEARSFGMSWYQRDLQHYVRHYQPAVSAPLLPAIIAPALGQ